MFTVEEWLFLASLGLAAGTLGGLLGVGGSLLVIPVLLEFFPFQGARTDIHLAIAAAMVMNTSVGAMSAYRHRQAGTMQLEVIRWLVPAALAGVAVGVLWGNTFEDEDAKRLLRRIFGLFALYVAAYNMRQFIRGLRGVPIRPTSGALEILDAEPPPPAAGPVVLVGFPAGLLGGLLGIGGGGVAVPLQQLLLGLRLKNAIGNSSLVVFTTSLVGAVLKFATLEASRASALLLAAGLVPASMLGAYWGAQLTRRLPAHWVVAPFVVLMLAMGCKLVLGN